MCCNTIFLNNCWLKQWNNGSFDVQGCLGITRFRAYTCINVSIMVIQLKCIFLNVWLAHRLKNTSMNSLFSIFFFELILKSNNESEKKKLTAPFTRTFFSFNWWTQSGLTASSTMALTLTLDSPCASLTDVTDVPSYSYVYVWPSS